jgi:hypothetical protein
MVTCPSQAAGAADAAGATVTAAAIAQAVAARPVWIRARIVIEPPVLVLLTMTRSFLS